MSRNDTGPPGFFHMKFATGGNTPEEDPDRALADLDELVAENERLRARIVQLEQQLGCWCHDDSGLRARVIELEAELRGDSGASRYCPRCGSSNLYWVPSPNPNSDESYAMCSDCTWGED